MKFSQTEIGGVWIVDVEPIVDERGFFARTWCAQELAARGLDPAVAQSSISFNNARGTLRGLHYQIPPHDETKLVRCTRGAIWDVALDLRRESPMFCRWVAVELSAANRRALYVPRGCAHGFQTLEDESEVLYMIAPAYAAESARGVRWDDPAFGIAWPLPDPILSPRDRGYPDYR